MFICLIMLLVNLVTYHALFLNRRIIQEENFTELKGSNLILLSFSSSVKWGTVSNDLIFQLWPTKISTDILFLSKETDM